MGNSQSSYIFIDKQINKQINKIKRIIEKLNLKLHTISNCLALSIAITCGVKVKLTVNSCNLATLNYYGIPFCMQKVSLRLI